MTSDDAVDIKEVVFLSQRVQDDYLGQSNDVLEAFDARMTAVQNLQRLPSKHHRVLAGALRGLEELRVSYDGNTYRTYYVATYDEAVIIIDAGMKKSKKDGEISAEQMSRLIERKRYADEFYDRHRDHLRARYEARRWRRDIA